MDAEVELAVALHQEYKAPAPENVRAWCDWFKKDVESKLTADEIRDWRAHIKASGEDPAQELARQCVFTWGRLKWYDSGMPVFEPTQSLAAAMTLTKFGKIPLGDIHFPYDSMVFRLPRPWLPAPFDTLSIVRLFKYASEEGPVVMVEASGKGGKFFRHTALLDEPTEAWIEGRDIKSTALRPVSKEELAVLRIVKRLALGTAIYVSSMTSENRKKSRVGKAQTPVRGGIHIPTVFDQPTVWSVGHDIKLPKELRQAAVDFATNTSVGKAGWKLSKRFQVRGHFHPYIVGKRSDHNLELIWTKPYSKGPESGMAIRRTYKVDEGGVKA